MLRPLLRGPETPLRSELASWTHALADDCRALLSNVLPLADHEREFLDRLNDMGEIRPDVLTRDVELQARLLTHPGLLWKALNVRQHQGLDPAT